MKMLGISCITNMAAGISKQKLDHREVMEAANRVRDSFVSLVKKNTVGTLSFASPHRRTRSLHYSFRLCNTPVFVSYQLFNIFIIGYWVYNGFMEVDGFKFVELFAGAGMARLGLTEEWNCILANDIDAKKCAAYRKNFSNPSDLIEGDIANISADMIHGCPNLIWASFPCQDISLAGKGLGLEGSRSSTYWQIWRILCELIGDNRRPQIVALENVEALLTIHGGKDMSAIITSLIELGYVVGVMVINARHFLPQSRPRVFIIAIEKIPAFSKIEKSLPKHPFYNKNVVEFFMQSDTLIQNNWVWFQLPKVPSMNIALRDIIINDFSLPIWDSAVDTIRLLEMMSPLNREKVDNRLKEKGTFIGTLYKRTRQAGGGKIQRAEVRFDGISGALRTPAGGSSRQTVIIIKNGEVRSRLILPQEAAALMGIPDTYKLPEKYNDAYHLLGDGVVVPVVTWLKEAIFDPYLKEICAKENPKISAEEAVYA